VCPHSAFVCPHSYVGYRSTIDVTGLLGVRLLTVLFISKRIVF